MSTDTYQLKSKTHFILLDGLRGVAALAVVIFHFMEMFIPDFTKIFIAHGFLAVDFFFCLSGFVVAYAYDDRIQSYSLKQFFTLRLIRLHPLVVLGTILGLLALLFDPFATNPQSNSFLHLALISLLSLLLIPYPVMPERAFNLFGLNAPAWTLFWEYVANVLYALFLHKLKKQWLLAGAVVMAGVLFGVTKTAGNITGGWSGENFWHGAARIGFSFLIGMSIFRHQWIIKNRLNFPILAFMLLLAFVFPFRPAWNWLSEPLIIIGFFPLIVSLGAGAMPNNQFKQISIFSGNISYPLYITHYFMLWAFGNYYAAAKPDHATLAWVIPTAILVQLAVAYLAMKYYDQPIRKYLNKKLT